MNESEQYLVDIIESSKGTVVATTPLIFTGSLTLVGMIEYFGYQVLFLPNSQYQVTFPGLLAPVNTVLPIISGAIVVGQQLSVNTGTWLNSPTLYSYQWLRNSVTISSATSNVYTLVSADVGTIIGVRVTARNSVGSASVTVSETDVVQATTPISSAGVFNSSGVFVRNLWSAQTNDSRVSNPAAAWDGTLDDGTVATTGTYTVKLLQHNIQAQWDGVVGNTSPNHTNNMLYHNEGSFMSDMAINSAGDMYYTTAYNERWPTGSYTTTANPQVMNYPLTVGFRDARNSQYLVTTDDTIAYYSWVDGDNNKSAVYGVKCSDKTLITFASGTSQGGAVFQPSMILPRTGTSSDWFTTGLAVQRSGNFLFATYLGVNTLLVANKTSGALLHTLTTWNLPLCLATSPTTGDLWLAYSPGGVTTDTIIKLSVDGAGNPTASGVSISGLSNIRSMDISPDGATLLVVDGAPSDQVKAFNTSDGSVKTAFGTSGKFGTLGGYANSPTVTNTKFMFKNMSHFAGL